MWRTKFQRQKGVFGVKNAEDPCLHSTRGFPNALIKCVYLEVLNS